MSGITAILDSDNYGPGNTQNAYLTSPGFSTSSATTVILEFDHFFQNIFGDTADVEVFDGNQWVVVRSFGGATTANPAHEIIDISAQAAGKLTVQVRFHYFGNWSWWWLIDNINIYQPQPSDLATLSVDSLITGCSIDSIPITATVANVGTDTIVGFALNYLVNGSGLVTENLTNTLFPGDTIQYTFTKQADLSAIGIYNVEVFTSSRNDANNVNDTARGTAEHLISVSSFPYNEGFETGNGGWTTDGVNNSWQLGTPVGLTINSAAGGTQAWVTNLSGTYNNNETSSVISPCFDFSSLAQPQIKLNIWIETENNWDGVILQSSTNGGQTWQMVGNLN
jgi:hypothetical protein